MQAHCALSLSLCMSLLRSLYCIALLLYDQFPMRVPIGKSKLEVNARLHKKLIVLACDLFACRAKWLIIVAKTTTAAPVGVTTSNRAKGISEMLVCYKLI